MSISNSANDAINRIVARGTPHQGFGIYNPDAGGIGNTITSKNTKDLSANLWVRHMDSKELIVSAPSFLTKGAITKICEAPGLAQLRGKTALICGQDRRASFWPVIKDRYSVDAFYNERMLTFREMLDDPFAQYFARTQYNLDLKKLSQALTRIEETEAELAVKAGLK
jgi:hypothetical protein